ncbi:hypothetical protein GDO78_008776 [Eleutherodactylus coqui]|uniref:Uncharacterized protein n=1 Tax=Eleutherodactylus coqui TaxID=57060 RepID=A0A8J6FE74_ELECQ|nr:hypothetical protein GDO78_008776 [Eleutherodactylus coqui]
MQYYIVQHILYSYRHTGISLEDVIMVDCSIKMSRAVRYLHGHISYPKIQLESCVPPRLHAKDIYNPGGTNQQFGAETLQKWKTLKFYKCRILKKVVYNIYT